MAFVDDLKSASDLDLLVSMSLLDQVPSVFGGDQRRFSEWKRNLAAGLDVDPHSIVIVGSAAVGVSLNPGKAFRAFDASSDIDVAVISPAHFEQAWWFMRTLGPRYWSLPPVVQGVVSSHRNNYLYWGTIATDRLIGWLPFGRDWLRAAALASSEVPIDGRKVSFRLYRDASALRLYQSRGFAEARARLLSPGA